MFGIDFNNFFSKVSCSFGSLRACKNGVDNNPIVAYRSSSKPVWSERSYESLANVGYSQNVIVFRSISLIAKSLSSVSWLLYKKYIDAEHEVQDHMLLKLLKFPSQRYSGAAFLESVFSQLLLSGNAYIEVSFNDNGVPIKLESLRSDRVKVMINDQNEQVGFEYFNKKNKRFIPMDWQTGRSNVLHLKTFNPLNDWYGMSPLEAAARSIDQHNAVGEHNLSILQNGGRPSGALLIKPQFGGVSLTPEQKDTLRNSVMSMYEGTSNAGRVMVLEGDCEWKEMGLSPKDLDFHLGKNMSAREIAQAFGVPPILIGLTEDATFSNYKEARINFWEDTLLPILNHFVSELNNWLVPLFDDDLRIDYDKDNIPALAARRDYIWSKMKEASFLSINEKREALGYSPVDWGNEPDKIDSV